MGCHHHPQAFISFRVLALRSSPCCWETSISLRSSLFGSYPEKISLSNEFIFSSQSHVHQPPTWPDLRRPQLPGLHLRHRFRPDGRQRVLLKEFFYQRNATAYFFIIVSLIRLNSCQRLIRFITSVNVLLRTAQS